MACDAWRGQLDPYLDGELAPGEASAVAAHLRICGECAADALVRLQMNRAVAQAGNRYQPNARFRSRVLGGIAAKARPQANWWRLIAVPVVAVIILAVLASLYLHGEKSRRMQVYSELTDLHVTALASASPFDVVSSDRHTVKPWFAGKIPFTFNLPEVQGSQFTLLGGRVTYLDQTPGAHLIYQIRKHEISVFIFQDRGLPETGLPAGPTHALSFNTESWHQDGLQYFVVGDVGAGDIDALSNLLRGAG